MNFQIFYSIDKRKTLKRKRKKGGAMVTIVQRAIIRQEASLEETLDFSPPLILTQNITSPVCITFTGGD